MEELFSRVGFDDRAVTRMFFGIWGENFARHDFVGFERGEIGEVRGGDEREDRIEFLV